MSIVFLIIQGAARQWQRVAGPTVVCVYTAHVFPVSDVIPSRPPHTPHRPSSLNVITFLYELQLSRPELQLRRSRSALYRPIFSWPTLVTTCSCTTAG